MLQNICCFCLCSEKEKDVVYLNDGSVMTYTSGSNNVSFFYDDEHSLINDKCPICLEDFTDKCELILLICKHAYHGPCILNWIKEDTTYTQCPLCKTNINTEEIC